MIKIKKKTLLSLCLITGIASTALTTQVLAAKKTNADAFFLSGFPSNTISSIKYWEDSAVSTLGYSGWALTARSDFDDVSDANISFTLASSESSADLRFYAGDYYWETYLGKMQPYTSTGSAVSDAGLEDSSIVWYKAHVLLNDGEMDEQSSSDYRRQYCVVHELGHALGLRHQDWFAGSVMEPAAEEGTSTDYRHPTSLDKSN